MQRVQADALRARPSTTARTVRRLTCHLRFVTLCAWLMRWPLIGVFPQNWQCWAMGLLVENGAAPKNPRSLYRFQKRRKKRTVLRDLRHLWERLKCLQAGRFSALSFLTTEKPFAILTTSRNTKGQSP